MASDRDFERISALFKQLSSAELKRFPPAGIYLDAPEEKGVYVIYSPKRKVLHVGQTTRAKRGIRQRLKSHLSAKSSFVRTHLKRDAARLRRGCFYSYVLVSNARVRTLLEAYSIGMLCPAHIGTGKKKEK